MNWLNKLERKFGRFAIKNLMLYIVSLNLAVFLLMYVDPTKSLIFKLMLEPELVMKGEVWRLVTYIFIPPETSLIWIIFTLYFSYLVGSGLEHEWGSFKFNVYYLIGMLCTTIAAFITGGGATAVYLNMSLFLAFAYIYPNYQILLFFVLPVKIKYLAWLDLAFIAFTVFTAPLPQKIVALVSIANYLLFFGRDMITRGKSNRTAYYNRREFVSKFPKDFCMHKCVVCGKTEKDDKNLEFRYCAKCEGDYEYCMEHLQTHEHVKKAE